MELAHKQLVHTWEVDQVMDLVVLELELVLKPELELELELELEPELDGNQMAIHSERMVQLGSFQLKHMAELAGL